MLNANNKLIGVVDYVPPPIPVDMDFIYLANDFDGTQIANRATNTTMGAYLQAGTITKNGSGSNCYLSNAIGRYNYLYTDISSAKLEEMKALNNTYTYFIRAYQVSTYNLSGGLICFRTTNDYYKYMIRCEHGQLQFHNNSGVQTLNLDANKVFKVTVTATSAVVSDMEGASQTVSITTERAMGTRMTSFQVGNPSFSTETHLDQFYGIAGIARATTAEEDAQIRTLLLTQGV